MIKIKKRHFHQCLWVLSESVRKIIHFCFHQHFGIQNTNGQKAIRICSCKNLGFNVCIMEMNYQEEREIHKGSSLSETQRQFLQMG